MNGWIKTIKRLPDNDRIVRTISNNGRYESLRYLNGRWYWPDQASYIYYTPEYWWEIR